jgi:hypothetical protein
MLAKNPKTFKVKNKKNETLWLLCREDSLVRQGGL